MIAQWKSPKPTGNALLLRVCYQIAKTPFGRRSWIRQLVSVASSLATSNAPTRPQLVSTMGPSVPTMAEIAVPPIDGESHRLVTQGTFRLQIQGNASTHLGKAVVLMKVVSAVTAAFRRPTNMLAMVNVLESSSDNRREVLISKAVQTCAMKHLDAWDLLLEKNLAVNLVSATFTRQGGRAPSMKEITIATKNGQMLLGQSEPWGRVAMTHARMVVLRDSLCLPAGTNSRKLQMQQELSAIVSLVAVTS
jgi:hypothetical protein